MNFDLLTQYLLIGLISAVLFLALIWIPIKIISEDTYSMKETAVEYLSFIIKAIGIVAITMLSLVGLGCLVLNIFNLFNN